MRWREQGGSLRLAIALSTLEDDGAMVLLVQVNTDDRDHDWDAWEQVIGP